MMRKLLIALLFVLLPSLSFGEKMETAPLPPKPFNASEILRQHNLLKGDDYQKSLEEIRLRIERELNATQELEPFEPPTAQAQGENASEIENETVEGENASQLENASSESESLTANETRTEEEPLSGCSTKQVSGLGLLLPQETTQRQEERPSWPTPISPEQVKRINLWRDPLRVGRIDWKKELEKVPIPFKDSELIAETLEDGDYNEAYKRISLFSGQPEIERFKSLLGVAIGRCNYVFPPTETLLLLLAKRGCWKTIVAHRKEFSSMPGGKLWVAQSLLRLGRWKDALDIFRMVPKGSWYRPWAEIKVALLNFAMGDNSTALTQLSELAPGFQAGTPLAENTFYLLGTLSLLLNRIDSAKGWFEKTITNGTSSPLDTRASYWLGWIMWAKGNNEKAAFHFSIALRGSGRLSLEERIEAVRLILDKGLEVDSLALEKALPASMSAVPKELRDEVAVLRGRVMLKLGKPKKAIALFRRVSKGENPCVKEVYPKLCFLTVSALVGAGEMDEAVNLVMLGNASSVPSLFEGVREIMKAMVDKGLCDQAIELGKNWRELEKDPVLLECLVSKYPPGKWFSIYQKAKRDKALSLSVAVDVVSSLVKNGFLDMAVVEIGDLLDNMPQPPYSYELRFLLAKALILQGNYSKAREIANALFKEVESQEKVAQWRVALGDACRKMENWQEALFYYQGVDTPEALEAMAQCYGAMGNKELQIETYKELFTKGEGELKCKAGVALAAHYLAQSLPSIAFSFVQNPTLCSGDEAIEFHTLRAKAMESLGRFKSAAKEYEQVFYLLPKGEPQRWRMLLSAAENYGFAGYKRKARRLLRFISNSAPDDGLKSEALNALKELK